MLPDGGRLICRFLSPWSENPINTYQSQLVEHMGGTYQKVANRGTEYAIRDDDYLLLICTFSALFKQRKLKETYLVGHRPWDFQHWLMKEVRWLSSYLRAPSVKFKQGGQGDILQSGLLLSGRNAQMKTGNDGWCDEKR